MTARPLLIVADDLTGACDTAGAVAALAGAESVPVHLDARSGAGSSPGPTARVTALDLDSRSAPVAQAVERTITAVMTAPGDVYLKIDSTLRGHVVATVSAAAGAFRAVHPGAHVVVCPAFPARGRLVVGRRVVLDGQPLASTALGELAALHGIEIAEASSDDDLAAIGGRATDTPTLWVGSAGLAPHVAGAGAGAQARAPGRAVSVAVVVGSDQGVSVDGAAALAGRGDDRLRVFVGDPTRPAFIDVAAEAADVDAVVVTGGFTARRLLDRLGIVELVVHGELEPGIPWATTADPPRTIVTKAGGFGDDGTLGRLVDRLLAPNNSA